MHDWSDNELDGMSREAADNYGPGRGMPDWEALQKQLDNELPQRKEDNRRRFFFLIFLCLVLTGITSYLLILQNSGAATHSSKTISHSTPDLSKEKNDLERTRPDKKNEAGTNPVNKQQENTLENKDGKINDKGQQPNTRKLDSKPSNAGAAKTSSALSLSTNQHNQFLVPGTNTRKGSGKKKKNNSGDESFAITVESGDIKRNNKTAENNIEPQKHEPPIEAATDVADQIKTTTPETSVVAISSTDNPVVDQVVVAKDTVATNTTVKKAPTVKSPPKGAAFEVSILAGVDASNVKFTYGDNAGLNAGLLLGYRFNKRWSVSTGVIYTKKNYTAAGTDFNPPKGYWTNGIKLDKVDGSCYMWEVPVYASYRFNSNKKSGWFVSMGVSSYFMTKEDYTYHYKYNNGNPATRYWKNNDPSNYWFSILGVSGGWEKNIGRGLSLGIAPYAKIPLKGVGFGNMHLSSYGLNLLLTYRKATGRK